MTAIVTAQVPFQDMMRLAEAIARSQLFGLRTADQALALMAIAQAEGRHPALAARDYDIIQGRPAKKAEAMLRDFLEGGGKVQWLKLSDTDAEATFSHPAGGTVTIAWDMKRAQQAGIGTKDNWKKFPRQMLRSRVVSEGVRTVYPMATSGMYVPEEVAEFEPAATPPMRDITPAPETPDALLVLGEHKAQEGTDALRSWWFSLSSQERGALGARGRSVGESMEKWKVAATAADERRSFGEPNGHADPTNWTAWALEIVDGMREADEDALVELSAKASAQAEKCPAHVMKDIDAAYVARRSELEFPGGAST